MGVIEHSDGRYPQIPMTDSLYHSYQWLTSDAGTVALAEAADLRARGLGDLKIGEVLRCALTAEQAALVLTQLDLRERARVKFRHAEQMLFTRAGLEQATSEEIASYRARRYENQPNIIDLCCGIGGDLMALAATNTDLTAVDLDPVHLLLAAYNVGVVAPGHDLNLLEMDVRNVPIGSGNTIFIDPARRNDRGRMRGYECEPPLAWAIELADRAAGVGIKAAPGIPHELVPADWELELISIGHDLKEAVLWSPELASATRQATTVEGGTIHSLLPEAGDEVSVRAVLPGDWLLDVNPAVTNAGLVQDLARQIGAERIDPEIGFLVTESEPTTPFAHAYRVIDVLPWHEKRIKEAISRHDIGPIDIRRRGLPGDVDAITRRLRGKGSRRAVIAMTRMDGVPTAIICEAQ